MIVLAGSSIVNGNIEASKSSFTTMLDGLVSLFDNPGAAAMQSVKEYMSLGTVEAWALTAILTTLKPIAFALIVCFMMSNILQQYMAFNNQMPMIILVKSFAYMCVAVVALDNIYYIVEIFVNLNNSFAETISTGLNEAMKDKSLFDNLLPEGESVENLIEAAKTNGLADALWNDAKTLVMSMLCAFMGVLTGFVNMIASLITSVVVYSAKLEMMIRFAFAPIAVAGLCSESHKNQAIHYLKKCLAAAMTCGAIMILMYIANILPMAKAVEAITFLAHPEDAKNAILGVPSGALTLLSIVAIEINCALMSIIAPFSALGAISTVKSIINEALGA